jgi:hypothetical protein
MTFDEPLTDDQAFAGSQLIVHGPSKSGFRWTDSMVGYALDRFHRRNLRTPTVREVKAGIDDLPSYATIQRRYGNVGNMLRQHGYRVRTPGGRHAVRSTS